MHLLGGHELCGSPRDQRVVGAHHEAIARRVFRHVDDAQRGARHVGNTRPRRVEPWIEGRAADRQLDRGAGDDVDAEQTAVEHERGRGQCRVRVVAHDAAGRFARPFTASSLSRGLLDTVDGVSVGVGVRLQEPRGIGHDSRLAGREVEHPEHVDRIDTRTRPQERHPRTVGSHPEISGRTKGEPSRAG